MVLDDVDLGPPIKTVFRLRDRIVRDPVMRAKIGSLLSGGVYDDFLRRFCELLPGPPPMSAIELSLRHLASQPLTEDLLKAEAWRLSAAYRSLRGGDVALPWRRQVEETPAICQVLSVTRSRRFGRHYATLAFRVLTGRAAGMLSESTWSFRALGAFSRSVGFAGRRGELQYEEPEQYVGLRLSVVFDPDASTAAGSPAFRQLLTDEATSKLKPASVVKYNKRLLRTRLRKENEFRCPQGQPATVPCHRCQYGVDRCPVAVHPVTYVVRHCETCGKDSWFDPRLGPSATLCLACRDRQRD